MEELTDFCRLDLRRSGVWTASTGDCEVMQGSGHSNQVQDLKVVGDQLFSVAMDDCMISSSVSSRQYGYVMVVSLARLHGCIVLRFFA